VALHVWFGLPVDEKGITVCERASPCCGETGFMSLWQHNEGMSASLPIWHMEPRHFLERSILALFEPIFPRGSSAGQTFTFYKSHLQPRQNSRRLFSFDLIVSLFFCIPHHRYLVYSYSVSLQSYTTLARTIKLSFSHLVNPQPHAVSW
jgi:hypothetical protein